MTEPNKFLRPRKPRWKSYEHLHRVELWRAVVLSFGMEPADLDHNAGAVSGIEFGSDESFWRAPLAALRLLRPRDRAKIEDRIRIAVDHLGDSLPILESPKDPGPVIETMVRFRDCAAWSERIGFDLPDGFPGKSPKQEDGDMPTTSEAGAVHSAAAMAATPPNWKKLLQPTSLFLYEAVALSIAVSPEQVLHVLTVGGRAILRVFPAAPQEFKDRLEVADRDADDAVLPSHVERHGLRKVKTVEFVTWATSAPRNWTLPPELLAIVHPLPLVEAPPAAEELSRRSRVPYEKLIAVLAEKAGYTLGEPYSDADSIIAHAKTLGIDIARSKTGEILTAAKARRTKK